MPSPILPQNLLKNSIQTKLISEVFYLSKTNIEKIRKEITNISNTKALASDNLKNETLRPILNYILHPFKYIRIHCVRKSIKEIADITNYRVLIPYNTLVQIFFMKISFHVYL